ncbi:hypothetical protein ACXWR7_11505, partial [Streptococcus pyogenes]
MKLYYHEGPILLSFLLLSLPLPPSPSLFPSSLLPLFLFLLFFLPPPPLFLPLLPFLPFFPFFLPPFFLLPFFPLSFL